MTAKEITLQATQAPVALRALTNFSYNGMISTGQYFISNSRKNAVELIGKGFAEEVTKDELATAEEDLVAKQLSEPADPIKGAVADLAKDNDWDWEDEDDDEHEPSFLEKVNAADTHAKLDELVAEAGLEGIPVKDEAKLVDRKTAIVSAYTADAGE